MSPLASHGWRRPEDDAVIVRTVARLHLPARDRPGGRLGVEVEFAPLGGDDVADPRTGCERA